MEQAVGIVESTVGPEDVFELPAALRMFVVPRRGDAGVGVDMGDAAASAAVAKYREVLVAVFEDFGDALSYEEAGLAEAMRGVDFADLERATPTSAAVAACCCLRIHAKRRAGGDVVADAWVATRGVAFAAQALVEAARMSLSQEQQLQTTDETRRYDFQLTDTYDVAVRVRTHLAVASDAEYAAAEAAVAPLRDGSPQRNSLTSFLFPQRRDWVDQDVLGRESVLGRSERAEAFLAGAVSTVEQGLAFARARRWSDVVGNRAMANLLAGLGTGAVPMLEHWLDNGGGSSPADIHGLLARIPSDEAFARLLATGPDAAPQLIAAAERFPRRGLRMLAGAAPKDATMRWTVAYALRRLVLARRELAEEVLPTLGNTARARIKALLELTATVPDAEPDTVPALLVKPPWTTGQKPAKQVVFRELVTSRDNEMAWQPGEREQYAAMGQPRGHSLSGPDDEARSLLAEARPDRQARYWLPGVIARFDTEALPLALRAATEYPETAASLMPFAASDVAVLMADWYGQLRGGRSVAAAWFHRHPAVTARTLIPTALGKTGPERRTAQTMLRMLDASGFGDEITAAASAHGDAVASAVANLLADDGTLIRPAVMPEPPAWADVKHLPQIKLKGRHTALPETSARYFVQMLMISKPSDPYAGLGVVTEACDTASLRDFVWALFENWQAVGHPPTEAFAFQALRWFGDAETVRRLAALIAAWPGTDAQAHAATGLDVLTGIGGDTALIHLYLLSRKVRQPALRTKAAQQVQAIADDLQLTTDQLGDRLVPDSGLDDQGSMTLDYGPRRFLVGFDEQLAPYVRDEAGKRLRALPKPAAKDDPELAEAAYRRFAGMRKDLRTLAADQIKRVEQAMVDRRRWNAKEFGAYFVTHPLLRHVVQRLVWATFNADDTVITTFRVAEDLTFATVEDESLTLPADASIGVAHPLDLGDDLTSWSNLFADYEIVQPFEQLARETHAFTPAECEARVATRFAAIALPPYRALSLEHRGWRRASAAFGGLVHQLLRELPDGRAVVAELTPGLLSSDIGESGDQRIVGVRLYESASDYEYPDQALPFTLLDAVAASEVLRDLTGITRE